MRNRGSGRCVRARVVGGGIVALSGPVDRATAESIVAGGRFLEVVLAPSFDDDAAAHLQSERLDPVTLEPLEQ